MQLANITLALGDDHSNTVPKWGVTPAEVAVLIAIHGESAVDDVNILPEEVARSSREERARLLETYGRAVDGEQKQIVAQLFPGIGARLPDTFAELGLAEAAFTPASVEKLNAPAPTAKKSGRKKADAPVIEPDADEDDGIEDMPPAGNVMG